MGDLNRLLAFLKEINFKPSLENFEDKLKVQKTVCLLELLGVDLGYPFSLYVRGPYSPSLTKELYDHEEIVNKCQSDYIPTEEEKKILHSIEELSNGLNPTMLEIMATYAYLIKELNNDEKEAIMNLKKLKSFYSEANIAIGVSRAKQLINKLTDEEIEEMKAEFAGFEEASLRDQDKS